MIMGQESQENQITLHVLLLIVFTVFGILLGVIIVISGWDTVALFPLTCAAVSMWTVHILDLGTPSQRIYFYVSLILLALVYYGYHDGPITDIPIILCLLIILLARVKDRKLISIIGLSYILYILENIFITGYLNPTTAPIVYSRIALGVVCLISATCISNHFIKLDESSKGEIDDVRAELIAAEKENERFLANMSHELRTPINAIRGTSDIMLNSRITAQDKRNALNIKSSARRLTRQVDDVLLYSELQNDRFTLNYTEYEPLSVINDAIADAFKLNKNGRLEFAIDVDQNLPRVLEGDPHAIKNLIVRLLDNSIKFTFIGGGYMHVSTREEEYGVNLNIDIHDTGCGITLEEQQKLFNGIYIVDSSSERKRGGLGLGLTIVQKIVSAMNGYVFLESKPNEGTHVHVTIPSKVIDKAPAFELNNPEKYKVLYFFNYSKYVRPEIAQYYQSMVDHIVSFKGLDVSAAYSMEEVKDKMEKGGFTHLFIAANVYRSEPVFIDKIASVKPVCVFGEPDFRLRKGSMATVISKPIFTLNVVNFLRNTADGVSEKVVISKEDYSGKLALVVDDDDMNLMVANGVLSQMGVESETANSGEASIEMCSSKNYDIIFMDYMMPEMNGIKAMRAIREIKGGRYKNVPIIVLTANAVSSAREDFKREGFDDFISKPIESVSLKKIISKYLGKGVER